METPSIIQNKQAIIDEINKARTEPKEYAKKIKSYVAYFKGNNILRIPEKIPIKTNEGATAFEEAAKFLNSNQPVSALKVSLGLNFCAQESLKEIQLTEDPSSLDNQNIDALIDKYGEIEGQFAQAVDFGSSSAELVVINLLVDDGDKSRANRLNLVSDNFRFIGVSSGAHSTYHNCSVLMFARTFIDKADLKEEDLKKFEQLHLTEETNKKKEKEKREKEKEDNLNNLNTNIDNNEDVKAENKNDNNIIKSKADNKEDNKEEVKEDNKNENKDEKNILKSKAHELGANKILSRVNAIEKGFNNNKANLKENEDDDFDLPEGVLKIERNEKVINENGVNKKIVKLTKYMEDGSIQTETFKELVK